MILFYILIAFVIGAIFWSGARLIINETRANRELKERLDEQQKLINRRKKKKK